MKIAVLGAGMVGRAIAIDLAAKYTVSSFDINEKNLQLLKEKNSSILTTVINLGNYEQYDNLLHDFDFVISAVPGFMGYKTLEAIIRSKKNVVDISFFPEDALQLHLLAQQMNVTAIVDCGVAPGMSNLILGYHNDLMKIDSFECLVGGLPVKRIKPFEYKAPFSPIDVLEEYTRPARYVENSCIVTKPALSDTELVNFQQTGTLEAFNTDGLRSILYTMPHIPNMKEKTLRYPGHVALMQSLISAGFLSTQKIKCNDAIITPLEFTSALLFDQWKLGATEDEFTIMSIIIKGEGRTIQYELYDKFDAATQTSSMSRTTGYTCTAVLQLLIDKLFTAKGVYPPELVGKAEACFMAVIQYLEERNIYYQKTEW
ncbi:MAG: saccharopine dehydrogenase NADP-binding domain-containing protein [Bacteroidetes bacterium]|nr:saccharopine dehydrogenase NADP-binding domain-containing protein [Bacteroidota bacterium]